MMSNNVLDPFAEMRMATLSAKYRSGDPAALPAQQILRLATAGSADALQLGNVGAIVIGQRADLIAVDLASPHLWPLMDSAEYAGNLIEQLVYAARGADVSTTVVEGRVLMSERRVRSLDEAEIHAEVGLMARDLARLAGVESFVNRRLPKQQIS